MVIGWYGICLFYNFRKNFLIVYLNTKENLKWIQNN